MLGTALTIKSVGHGDVTLKGAHYQDVRTFSETVRDAWVRFNLQALEKESDRLERILAGVRALEAPSQYPPACQISPLLDEARALDASLLSRLQPEAVGAEAYERIAPVRKFAADPRTARSKGIATFVTAELNRWNDFFDTIESNPLTPEQRLSVVVDEDATLVLAGAGSGKTSVITAKAAYLVKAEIRQPEEILLLAFARNAAEEMSERVEARSGVPIVARTFHALAYDIIGIVEGSKPALADHATDDMAFSNLIKQILRDLVHALSDVSKAIIAWFAHFFVEPKTEWDFKTKHEFYTHLKSQDLRTFGYRRLFVLLRREGEPSGINRIYRLYREEGLTVRKRRTRRKAVGSRAPILVEARPNARWSLDFVHDQLACGRRFRILNVVDDVTRECLLAMPNTSISGKCVARELDKLIEQRDKPGMIVSDNGTELTSNAILAFAADRKINWHYIARRAKGTLSA